MSQSRQINPRELPCPYQSLKQYLRLRGNIYQNPNEQFFVFSDHSAVTVKHFRSCLRRTIINAGFAHPHLYLVHGLHASRACDLLQLGIPVNKIKYMGRWKSNAVYRYLK